MHSSNSLIWLLADDRPGNVNQALGVAQALGLPFERKEIRYTSLARLPNLLRGTRLLGLTDDSKESIAPPWPQVAINAGRRGAPVLRHIKRHSPETLIVQLMWPEAGLNAFDLIALPAHDERPARPNLIATLGAPSHLTAQKLDAAARAWRPQLAHLPRPYLAVLVGGASRYGRYLTEDGIRLGERAAIFTRETGGSVLVTTSRRSDPAVVDVLAAALGNAPHFLYRWSPDAPNPYLAMLALADAILVTGDSMSMCSEACGTGKPVAIYAPLHLTGPKHRRLHDRLFAGGYAVPFGAPWNVAKATPALNDAQTVANAIRKRLTTAHGTLDSFQTTPSGEKS